MTWFDGLYERAKHEDQRPHILRAGRGRLLVVEHGARVLACELQGVDHNLFFCTGETKDGKLTGGDRLWIAPEVAYFWPSLDDALRDPKHTAKTPGAIDPSDYQSLLWPEAIEREVTFSAFDISLVDQRDATRSIFNLTRHCGVTEVPVIEMSGLQMMSFRLANSISFLFPHGEDAPDEITLPTLGTAGCWSILQVPPTGTLICPTVARADVRSYYEPFGDRHVEVEDRCVRFFIDGRHRIKMGLRPEHITGRMGYYRPLGNGQASLIIRVFPSLPGEPYCDLPRDDPRHRQLERGEIKGPLLGGDALQAYNDDGDAFGGGPEVTFGEMEYHDPCVIAGQGPTSRSGTSVTHVVAGPDVQVRRFGEQLLGVPITPIE